MTDGLTGPEVGAQEDPDQKAVKEGGQGAVVEGHTHGQRQGQGHQRDEGQGHSLVPVPHRRWLTDLNAVEVGTQSEEDPIILTHNHSTTSSYHTIFITIIAIQIAIHHCKSSKRLKIMGDNPNL